eukprot:COSAG04_NODE_2697_length_3716_cov_5.217307_2_plen_326_part_00
MVSHDGMEDYTLESELGHGAFGVAFLALRNSDRRQCVVKRIKMREMSKRDALAAEREVTVMQKVAHPNIIGYYDSFVSQENMHIVMEYADGGTLYTVLRSALHTGPLAESSVLAYFAQLLAAVRCLHQNHILHRDLKSPNVFLTLDNTVKLGDFGLSRVLASNSFAKSTVGTVPQLSPELCKGKPYGTECDVWALGCLLYEMTHRRNAFKEHSLPATVMKIMRGDFALDATQVIPTPSHLLDRISPIFSPFFPVLCAFSPSERGGSNEPQAGTQGQETVARGSERRFSGLANSGCWERMAALLRCHRPHHRGLPRGQHGAARDAR